MIFACNVSVIVDKAKISCLSLSTYLHLLYIDPDCSHVTDFIFLSTKLRCESCETVMPSHICVLERLTALHCLH